MLRPCLDGDAPTSVARFAGTLGPLRLAPALDEERADFTEGQTVSHVRVACNSRFFDAFWLPEKGWYAIALDNSKRLINALTSNRPLLADRDRHRRARRGTRRTALRRRNELRLRAAHPGHDDGRQQPDELPQRLGVAARHRHRGGLLRYRHLPKAVRLAERLADGLLDAADAFDGACRIVLPIPPMAVLPAGALSHRMLTASIRQRRTATVATSHAQQTQFSNDFRR